MKRKMLSHLDGGLSEGGLSLRGILGTAHRLQLAQLVDLAKTSPCKTLNNKTSNTLVVEQEKPNGIMDGVLAPLTHY